MALSKELLCHTVTIFNRLEDDDGTELFRGVWLKNVRIEQRIGIFQQKDGQFSHDTFKLFADPKVTEACRVNTNLEYRNKQHFMSFPFSDKMTYWTFAEGDYLVPEEVPLSLEDEGLDDIRKYEQVFVINSVNPVYAGKMLHHWEVSGRGRILE